MRRSEGRAQFVGRRPLLPSRPPHLQNSYTTQICAALRIFCVNCEFSLRDELSGSNVVLHGLPEMYVEALQYEPIGAQVAQPDAILYYLDCVF